jgi:HSP20 family protein
MNRVFEDFFGELEPTSLFKSDFTPKMNVREDENSIYVEAEIPGVKKEDVDIIFENGVLTIKGEKKEERKEEKGEKTYIQESYYGGFERSFSLSQDVDLDKCKANFKDGILKITLPKTEESKEKQKISIE